MPAWFIIENNNRRVFFSENGIPVEDLKHWVAKWHALVCHCEQTNKECTLSFYDYVNLALVAGIADYTRIGKSATSMQLGRIGDTGGYTMENCRFITKRQNMDERCLNGGTARGSAKLVGKESKTRKPVSCYNVITEAVQRFASGKIAADCLDLWPPQVCNAVKSGCEIKSYYIKHISEEEYQACLDILPAHI